MTYAKESYRQSTNKLIQVQIRLEEEFLLQKHGEEYAAYKKKVNRLI